MEVMSDTASERARARLREEMSAKHLNQVDVAGLLKWTQSRVSKVLSGTTGLGLEELESLCFAVGLRLTEVVRDHGLEFCAEMTPTELRTLERLRALDKRTLDAFLQLLDVKAPTNPERYALKPNTAGQRRKQTG